MFIPRSLRLLLLALPIRSFRGPELSSSLSSSMTPVLLALYLFNCVHRVYGSAEAGFVAPGERSYGPKADLPDSSAYKFQDNHVKCFCDKAHCPGSLTCTGKWCLIGMRNDGDDSGWLDQICGWDDSERPVSCAHSWNKWSEVCACDEPLCNTFAFLRMHSADNNNRQKARRGYGSGETSFYLGGGDRFDEPPMLSGNNHYPSSEMTQFGGWTSWHKSGNIVVLLIVTPLCVGGFVVLFVFLNYHCRMQ